MKQLWYRQASVRGVDCIKYWTIEFYLRWLEHFIVQTDFYNWGPIMHAVFLIYQAKVQLPVWKLLSKYRHEVETKFGGKNWLVSGWYEVKSTHKNHVIFASFCVFPTVFMGWDFWGIILSPVRESFGWCWFPCAFSQQQQWFYPF